MNERSGGGGWRAGLALMTLSLGAAAFGVHAEIHTRVDAQGVIHLTNVPTRGSGRGISPQARSAGSARLPYAEVVDRTALEHALHPALVHAVIRVESGYRADALSLKGAVGLMQLMPGTARRYGVTDARDPRDNVRGGVLYLRDLLTLFNGDVQLALAAYNAGENAVLQHGGVPPYGETVLYVRRVLDEFRRLTGTTERRPP